MENNINSLFVNYSQAKELKELGFDEGCFGFYNSEKQFIDCLYNTQINELNPDYNAPLKQQVFSFALTKHSLCCSIIPVWGNLNYWYSYQILNITNGDKENYSAFETYEQAESECIDKLISLIKNK